MRGRTGGDGTGSTRPPIPWTTGRRPNVARQSSPCLRTICPLESASLPSSGFRGTPVGEIREMGWLESFSEATP